MIGSAMCVLLVIANLVFVNALVCEQAVTSFCYVYQQGNCQGTPAPLQTIYYCAQGICLNASVSSSGTCNTFAFQDQGFVGGCTTNGCPNIFNGTNPNNIAYVTLNTSANNTCVNLFGGNKSMYCAANTLLHFASLVVITLFILASVA